MLEILDSSPVAPNTRFLFSLDAPALIFIVKNFISRWVNKAIGDSRCNMFTCVAVSERRFDIFFLDRQTSRNTMPDRLMDFLLISASVLDRFWLKSPILSVPNIYCWNSHNGCFKQPTG